MVIIGISTAFELTTTYYSDSQCTQISNEPEPLIENIDSDACVVVSETGSVKTKSKGDKIQYWYAIK